ncbi:MAG: HAD hydrolase-like protein [Clostridia bacterium]|nr:HAD hydrolase-like protein [Clostridia bacterium]
MDNETIIFPSYIIKAFCLLEEKGFKAYAVGGCIRDFLSGTEPCDYDMATDAMPEDIISVFKDYKINRNGIKHGTVRIIIDGNPVEITSFRCDGEYNDCRHPNNVSFIRNIESDLTRRDFTVNAMAMDKNGKIIDLFGGKNDIKNKIIRSVGDPRKRFSEDALRILRGLRFASKTGFTVESETYKFMISCKGLLNNISNDRIRIELGGILTGKYAGTVLRRYKEIIFEVIPELRFCDGFDQRTSSHIYDVYNHITYTVEKTQPLPDLRFAALFHDIAKPRVFFYDERYGGRYDYHAEISADIALKIMKRLNFSKEDTVTVYNLIKEHDTYTKAEKIPVYKRISRYSLPFCEKLFSLQYADNEAKSPNAYPNRSIYNRSISSLIASVKAESPCLSVKELDINGHDLENEGIFGSEIKHCLRLLLDKVIEGKISNSKDKLIEYLSKIKCSRNYMKDKKYILFDLDGTLTDPAEGITNSVIHALEGFGIYGKTKEDLLCFIGPPLDESFMKYFNMTHDEAVKAIEIYREHFAVKGLFENKVYEGVEDLLLSLKKNSKKLILATSKPGVFADRILEHFNLMKYFDLTVGSELNGDRIKKADVIAYALEKAGIENTSDCVMVGDRCHDIDGAKKNNIETIGVTYGYGSFDELTNAGAEHIVNSVSELEKLLIGGKLCPAQ